MPRRAGFPRLFAAATVSNLGDGVRLTAIPLLAASLTRDPSAIAAVTAVVWLPWLVFGVLGGAIVDRVHRVRLLAGVQVGRMLVIGGLAGMVWTDNASMALIYAAAFLIGIGEVIADTTMQTLIPAIVPEHELERGNGQLYAAQAVSNEFVGPPVGSVLFSLANSAPFAANAVTWGTSALILSRLHVAQPSRAGLPPTTLLQDVVAGARWLWAQPVLRALLMWGALVNASLVSFGSISVLFALEILGVSEASFGFLAAAGGLGGIAGTLVAGRVVRRVGRSRVIQGGAIVGGLASLAAGLVSHAVAFGALMFLLTAAAAMVTIVVAAMRQSIIPSALLGRVSATFRVFSYGSIPLGAMFGGWLAASFGLRAPFLLGGAVVTIAGLFIGRWVTQAAIDRAREAARPAVE